jgi:hypothetical protein
LIGGAKMYTLNESLKDLLKSPEEEKPVKVKLAKKLEICPIKTLVDPELKKELSMAIIQIEQIIQRSEKEFEFAGFSIDEKCEAKMLKSIQQFDKSNKQYTPLDILEIEKYHKNKLRLQATFDVIPEADAKKFYTIIYRETYQELVAMYETIDMIVRIIDGRYITVTVFRYKTRFNKGEIYDTYVVASPNPLDLMAPVVLHEINFEASWFGKPK